VFFCSIIVRVHPARLMGNYLALLDLCALMLLTRSND
jgi:hypothetical protein